AAATLREQRGLRTTRTRTFPSGAVWEGTWQDWRVPVTKADQREHRGPRVGRQSGPDVDPAGLAGQRSKPCRCRRSVSATGELDGPRSLLCGRRPSDGWASPALPGIGLPRKPPSRALRIQFEAVEELTRIASESAFFGASPCSSASR